MSTAELRIWNEYRARGFLITARTHDYAAATVARSFAGGKLSDYMLLKPSAPDAPISGRPLSPAQAMALLGGKIAKRRG